MRNYCEILYSNLGRNSRGAAVWYEGETYSYEQLCGFVDGFSSFLFKRGVSRGDRVCVFLPNSLSLAVSVFSIARLGAACVPIDSACGTEEIKHCLEFSEPALIVTDESLEQTVTPVSGGIKTVSVTRDDFTGDAPAGPPGNSLADKAIYLFSTGSTGKPKCVARSHGNMIALARNHTATINWDSGDRILFSIPISHTYGLGNFVSAVSVGACCYFLPKFVRREVLGVLEKEQITVFPAVPFMLETLARSASRGDYDFPRLKHVISAGAPLAEETFFSFHSAFGTYPRQLYGSSETGVMTINVAENIVEKRLSVGVAVENVVVRVVSENGSELPAGEIGEITINSPSMTDGYVDFPEETERVFVDGFYHTGDLGMFDSDGYLFIRGRKKLFINISGNKVDPYEVESLLMTHEKITEAAVVGAPGAGGREEVQAFIVADGLTRREVVDFCRGKISDYKIPVKMEFLDALPRSPAGKVLREKLK
ncbi:MAG: acyl--CoA ligase [Candidatus Dadabacteria bacterium]|nr:acyl--CoA ligase [Candidatus Dadabacteria bacterium]MYC40560.1 acyl--CoA ligase [Candidatus Dadabacteria bacterium]